MILISISLLLLGIGIIVTCLYTHHLSYIHNAYTCATNSNSKTYNFPIDIIYTWVDGQDPHHQDLIRSYNQPISYRRYANNNELYISLKSIEKNAPWVRHIYIVTADYQRPNTSMIPSTIQHKIKHIKHSDIIPNQFLPQFASQVIESFLYRIPGLANQFIYFNDDMFLGNTTTPTDFFNPNGHPYMLYTHSLDYYSNSIKFLLRNTTRNSELRHSIHFFRKLCNLPKKAHYGFYKKPLHQCYPASKTLFESLWNNNDVKKFLLNQANDKFRSYNQLNCFYLMYLYGFHQQKAQLKHEPSEIFKELHTEKNVTQHMNRVFSKQPKLFCLNNELDTPNKKLEDAFQNSLKRYFT